MHLIVYKNPLTSTLDSREQIANSSAQWKVVLTFGSIQIDLLMVRETGDEDAFGNLLLGCQQRASSELFRVLDQCLRSEIPQQPHVDVWRRMAGQVLQGELEMEKRGLAWSGLPRSQEAD